MIFKSIKNRMGGFSLLEMTIVIIIATIMASAVIPQLTNAYLKNAANKTALDISAIQEASRAFYIANNKWPDNSVYATPIAALQAENYLPSSWKGINPFGSSSAAPENYTYNVTSNNSLLTVSTNVPVLAQPLLQSLLPVTSVVGDTIYSSVPLPGTSSVLPSGTIIPWASNNLPVGFLWCNGQTASITSYPNLYAVLGTTYGGDGINTFGLPNLMGRVIVGVDAMGGAAAANLITMWGSVPATMGGTFGEDVHALTIAEMPPHDFVTHAQGPDPTDPNNAYLSMGRNTAFSGGGGSEFGGSPVPDTHMRTGWRGGNNDGSPNSTVVPHNVVQPSIALGYIIKY